MFEEAQQRIGDGSGFMEVTFEDDTPMYQYRPECHNITEMDDAMAAAMSDVVERHDLEKTASHTDPNQLVGASESLFLRFISSIINRLFSSKQSSSDLAWVTACHSQPVSAADEYTVFEDICKMVYGCSVDTVLDVTIHVTDFGMFSDGGEVISWTEVWLRGHVLDSGDSLVISRLTLEMFYLISVVGQNTLL